MMRTQSNRDRCDLSNAAVFQAAHSGLAGISEQVGELSLSEMQLLLLLASKRLGAWVPLLQVKAEMPGLSAVKISRALKKLELSEHFVVTRASAHSGREKELRLTSLGLKVAKKFAKPFNELEAANSSAAGVIPNTSKQRYLTGKTALNIPSKNGTGDWHFFETFQGSHGRDPGPFFIAGEDLLDTAELLADEGIEECGKILKAHGAAVSYPVYAASHARAMADMLNTAIKKNQSFESAYNLDDWFPDWEDKKALFHLIEKLRPGMSPPQWRRLDKWVNQWKMTPTKATG